MSSITTLPWMKDDENGDEFPFNPRVTTWAGDDEMDPCFNKRRVILQFNNGEYPKLLVAQPEVLTSGWVVGVEV